jgi:hypothetical protein
MTYGGDATATLSVVIALERTGAGERALVMPRAVPMGYSSQP